MYPIGVILNSWPGANKNRLGIGESEAEVSRGEIGPATEKKFRSFLFSFSPHPCLSSQFFLPLLSCCPYFPFFLSVVCKWLAFIRSQVVACSSMQVMFAYTREVENTRATVRVRNIFMDAALCLLQPPRPSVCHRSFCSTHSPATSPPPHEKG